MSDLTISRLTATLHPIEGCDDAERRVDRILRRLADERLDAGLARHPLPEGEWCVRTIDVALQLDPAAHEATTESEWADALLASLEQALRAPPPHTVVHYRNRRQALAELVGCVAIGANERRWAWRQLGLLEASEPSPEADPAGAIVAAARRAPDAATAAVVAAVATVGFAPLHRALGRAGWVALAAIVAEAAGVAEPSELIQTAPPTAVDVDDDQLPHARRGRTLAVDSTIAAGVVRSGLRPHGAASALAVLIIAESDPAALRGPHRTGLVAHVARRLVASDPTVTGLVVPRRDVVVPPATEPDSIARLASDPGTAVERPASADTESAAVDRPSHAGEDGSAEIAKEQSDAHPVWPSEWCGILFLLATATDAGLPDRLLDDRRLAARPVRWVMHQLAQVLAPVEPDNPVALAFAGLPPTSEVPEEQIATPDERLAIEDVATAWIAATLARFEPTDLAIEQVLARRGEIEGEGGWIDVRLRLDDVDLDVRRAGLDIDPGWVPWLGVVVRFVYE